MSDMRPINILLIEDNEGDVFLTKKAFEKAKVRNAFKVAPDGEIALEMLREQKDGKYVYRPDLILLDINLPKKDGRQVLSELKTDENLQRIPVIILTSSSAEKDVLSSYDLHANSYIIKPVNFDNMVEVVATIENFWFNIVTLPADKSEG